ncbi:MAG: GNAT family acetyltransferase [Longimicrobiales bacterium]
MTPGPPQVRVGVGVVIRRGDEILLIRRSASHGSGTWSTPGGHIDPGESLEECAVREALEETGVHVGNVRFRAVTNDVFEDEGKHYVTVWMDADYRSGEASVAADYELTEVGWFPWDYLPEPLFLPLLNLLEGRCHGKSRDVGSAPRRTARFPRKLEDGASAHGPTIRSFRESDRSQLEALWTRVFPDDPPRNAPGRMIDNKLKVQPELLLVAATSEALVGAVVAGFDGTRGWIHHLAVHRDFRRRGIATALVRSAEEGLRELGCPKVNLQIRATNSEVQAFYRGLGYEVEERISMGKVL